MEALEAIAASAGSRMDWALALLGGSVLAILSTSYTRPAQIWIRLMYLIYIPAWGFIGFSMHRGRMIEQRHIAAIVNNENINDIVRTVNRDYSMQQNMLFAGLALFIIWLLFYLVWWIFSGKTEGGKSK